MVEEDFKYSGGTVSAPGMFGTPSEDCNCRCALLTRARWALDEDELNTLKERAEFFGLDKTEDFEDYTNNYLESVGADKVNYAKASDILLYRGYPVNTIITPEAIVEHLETSEIGKRVIEYIGKSGVKPQLVYEKQWHNNRGEQQRNTKKIYVNNIANNKIAAQTVIHEITHHMYNIGGCQWAEAVCMANEKMHIERRSYLTSEEKRYIVKLVRRHTLN
ncbi:MAG: hypothetical protein K6G65_06620 [Lachnospiraceae bacterium]|nr:hypothetical protein [Lachnospiraceae bacterium]